MAASNNNYVKCEQEARSVFMCEVVPQLMILFVFY